VASVRPGEEAKMEILRDRKEKTLEVHMGVQPSVEPEEDESDLGFHVQEITEHVYRSQRLATREGAYVSFVARGSPASEAGLFPGDVIERVEERDVESLDDFRNAMSSVENLTTFLVTTRRGEETKFLLLKRGAQPHVVGSGTIDPAEPTRGP
jgi:serine protease Do